MRGSEHKILPMHMHRLPGQTKYLNLRMQCVAYSSVNAKSQDCTPQLAICYATRSKVYLVCKAWRICVHYQHHGRAILCKVCGMCHTVCATQNVPYPCHVTFVRMKHCFTWGVWPYDHRLPGIQEIYAGEYFEYKSLCARIIHCSEWGGFFVNTYIIRI